MDIWRFFLVTLHSHNITYNLINPKLNFLTELLYYSLLIGCFSMGDKFLKWFTEFNVVGFRSISLGLTYAGIWLDGLGIFVELW